MTDKEKSDEFILSSMNISKETIGRCSIISVALNLFEALEKALETFEKIIREKKTKKFIKKDKELYKNFGNLYGYVKASMGMTIMLSDKLEEKHQKKQEKAND